MAELLAETSSEFDMLLWRRSVGTDALESGGPGGASLTLPASGSARPFFRNGLASSYGNEIASPRAGKVMHLTWSTEPTILSLPVTLAGR